MKGEPMSDFEKLINASDLIKWIIETYPDWYMGAIRDIYDHIVELASAQPELDEWCDDCKEYDQQNHSCPRFNRVIRETLDDVRKEAYKHGKSKGIKRGMAMARRKEAGDG